MQRSSYSTWPTGLEYRLSSGSGENEALLWQGPANEASYHIVRRLVRFWWAPCSNEGTGEEWWLLICGLLWLRINGGGATLRLETCIIELGARERYLLQYCIDYMHTESRTHSRQSKLSLATQPFFLGV